MVPLVAKNKGYWDAEGLRDVEITIVGPAPTHMAALVGGSIDFSINITTDTLMRANVRGEPVYAVAGSSNKNSYALFGHSSIRSVADLRGRSLAIDAPGATIEYLTAEVLEKHGLRRGDYTLVPISGTIEERSAAAVSGAVQAALGSLSDWPALRDRGATLLAKVEDVYPDFQFAVTAARGPMLDERPATVVAFLKGLSRGFQFVQQPGNAGEILKILEDNDVSVDKTYWDEMLGLQRSIMSPDGRINRGGVEVVIQREKEAGRVPADYSMDQLVRLGPLEQAQRELGIS
jgi:ABC-type nitrate/sulfonate/bicarbonate transport system substrate-binding protein